MKSRVLAEMRALGPRPSWWRPFKRRRWQRQYRALAILYLSLVFEEQVRAIRIVALDSAEGRAITDGLVN